MSMFVSRNWADLPCDVWLSIGLKLDAPSDRIRFRAVSKTFRSNLPYRQPPCLMLAEFHDDSDDDIDDSSDSDEEEDSPPRPRRFYFLGEQKYHKFNLPQVQLARSVGSTNNWLITVKKDTIVRLLNPFTNLEFDLPSILTFRIGDPRYEVKPLPSEEIRRRDTFLRKVIISPSSDFLVIAVHDQGKLAMARPGDSSWITFNVESKHHTGVRDITVFNGLLYAITFTGLLLSSDFLNTCPKQPPQLSFVQQFDVFKPHPNHQLLYLVEWCGQLLLVIKTIEVALDRQGIPAALPYYKTDKFQIYKFDFINRNWTQITSLGEYSLFLGFNTSVAVLASNYFGFVKKNCIYFTDDFIYGRRKTGMAAGRDMGVFNLEDNTITPHYKGLSICYSSPPIWIVPDSNQPAEN